MNLKSDFEKYGRVWLRNALSENELSYLDEAADTQVKAGQRLRPSDGLNKAFSANTSLMKGIRQLDPNAKAVRVVAFNKSEEANWGVPWHQDRIIAIDKREDIAGYSNWSRKAGIWHCEPPQDILDQMLFVRVHLDDNDQSNGAMEIAVGSHINGMVAANEAENEAQRYPIEVCNAKRGDVLILKMLTLHSSKPAKIQSGRRVIRIDFSSAELPEPLKWASVNHES
ncbi:MAG TPA: phytanoyl-CoA dioxygenase [Rhizobiales bacterium]|nr:phytanoyl-CoA dioxygenase [Hyphomicrobiales bacterium]